MIASILNFIEEYRCKRGIGVFRPWNREELRIFHINRYPDESGRGYIEQIRDGVIETMVTFTKYPYIDFIDEVLNSKSLLFQTFFHQRFDDRRRWFEGVTLSFSSEVEKNRYDRVDLIFEDVAVDGEFDREVNQVRLYVSPLKRYLANDYDLLYWDSSDKRSLEIFQTGYRDNIYFYKKDRERRGVKRHWKYGYTPLNHRLKNSAFL